MCTLSCCEEKKVHCSVSVTHKRKWSEFLSLYEVRQEDFKLVWADVFLREFTFSSIYFLSLKKPRHAILIDNVFVLCPSARESRVRELLKSFFTRIADWRRKDWSMWSLIIVLLHCQQMEIIISLLFTRKKLIERLNY